MTPDNEAMRRFITCSDCGCLIETSYYATHTGCCPGKKSMDFETSLEKAKKSMRDKGYWR